MKLQIGKVSLLYRAIESVEPVQVAPDVWSLRIRTVSGAEYDYNAPTEEAADKAAEFILRQMMICDAV